LIAQDLNKFKTNEIYIDDNKRRRDEWIKYYSYIIKNFKVDLSLDLIMIITLKETIDNQIQRILNNKNNDLVEIIYLFYNAI
jgi:transcription initiation factor IIE alpha subunit